MIKPTTSEILRNTRPETRAPPIFIGPTFIHGDLDFRTYSVFFAHLSDVLVDTDTSKLVICTDGEKAFQKYFRLREEFDNMFGTRASTKPNYVVDKLAPQQSGEPTQAI